MQNIVYQKVAFQILPLNWKNDVSTEISLTVRGITRPTAKYYYIGICVIKSDGRLLVRPLTVLRSQDSLGLTKCINADWQKTMGL